VRLAGFALALLLLVPALQGQAQTEYVRDEIRINLRGGPGDRFQVVRVLVSGDPVTRLDGRGGWVKVRTREGSEGWLPDSYLAQDLPASIALPRLEAKLAQAKARVDQLERELEGRAGAAEETEALLERNAALELQTKDGATRWRTMSVGAAIALAGLVIGALLPRSGGGRSRRIKL
jgi:SH3 domain protein